MDFINGKREYDLVERLSFTRVCGTEQERKAAEIIMEELKSFGLEPWLEKFDITTGNVDASSLEILEPYSAVYDAGGYRFGPSTAEGGEEYELEYVEKLDGTSLRRAKGKFALLNEARVGAEELEKLVNAGVAGFMTMSGNVDDEREKTDLDHRRYSETMRSKGTLPAITVRMPDAFEMVRRGAKKIRVTLRTSEQKDVSQNVVAEIKGTDLADEIIVLGAHYDSTWLSKGAWDNAAGVALICELARWFKENPPRRTLRFVMFGSEEIGLCGSKAYVEAHKEDVEKIVLMINADVGGSVLGQNGISVTAAKSFFDWMEYLLDECGFSAMVRHGVMSSDSTSFADAGIPAISFSRGGTHGMNVMHTHGDNMSLIGEEALASTARIALEAARRLVNAEHFPVPREFPDNIKEELDKYAKR